MREIRQSGSEGGGTVYPVLPTSIKSRDCPTRHALSDAAPTELMLLGGTVAIKIPALRAYLRGCPKSMRMLGGYYRAARVPVRQTHGMLNNAAAFQPRKKSRICHGA